ncbi:hypothetical protein HBHAL_1349 [Halobacillus halophilus DSM 2266]|uniref:Secreted protein n=1 Tax=Halobacillus halophilus (strain ATCC 35676 / DSM 2266 / JCM 20832 / KCTC 3685 / LMG 17431 / NBRC 102448 / NCIMB 2269) TaxID=866895 RepID=I0JHV4_HALH3|nr:hypothetical protein [Halobacillus halophilus]CCG43722.1 hypothetical protein HBHAL_1349 [Halobacillus halophilus DSM 2266]
MKRRLTVILLGLMLAAGTFGSAPLAFDNEKDQTLGESSEVTLAKFKAHDPGDLGMG